MPKPSRASNTRSVVPQGLARDRESVRAFIDRSRTVVETLGAPALLGEVDQLAASAHKPFLFVAVGEVKSGKSSLINALLEAPVCAVDSAPCTDRVQEINYGAKKRRIKVSAFEEHLHLPHDILRHITIVDTPGVNSILRDHQVITENYIPQSDLVLFVFFAKNPYTGSAWDFLHHIKHQWQRNTLFVLQQADLLNTEDLERTVALVRQQLTKQGIAAPVVFPVSVLTGAGVDTLRHYLRTEVVKGRQFNKSISLTHNLLRFLGRVEGTLENHRCLLDQDEKALANLRRLIHDVADDAKREHHSLAGLAQRHVEEMQRWLESHFAALREPFHSASQPRISSSETESSRLDRLGQQAQGLLHSSTLRDALLSGRDTPLRVSERFSRLHGELTRCLFQAEMQSLALFHNRKRDALQLLDAVLREPPCLTQSPRDAIARRRLQSLRRVRKAVQTIGEQMPAEAAPQLPGLHAIGRWSLLNRVIQGVTAVGCLLLGYSLGDLFAALMLGVTGYLGSGLALAARSRARTARHARKVLDRRLIAVEQRLNATLIGNAVRLQGTLQQLLNRFEVNVAKRRAQIEELRALTATLRADVESFESATWLQAVEHED